MHQDFQIYNPENDIYLDSIKIPKIKESISYHDFLKPLEHKYIDRVKYTEKGRIPARIHNCFLMFREEALSDNFVTNLHLKSQQNLKDLSQKWTQQKKSRTKQLSDFMAKLWKGFRAGMSMAYLGAKCRKCSKFLGTAWKNAKRSLGRLYKLSEKFQKKQLKK